MRKVGASVASGKLTCSIGIAGRPFGSSGQVARDCTAGGGVSAKGTRHVGAFAVVVGAGDGEPCGVPVFSAAGRGGTGSGGAGSQAPRSATKQSESRRTALCLYRTTGHPSTGISAPPLEFV